MIHYMIPLLFISSFFSSFLFGKEVLCIHLFLMKTVIADDIDLLNVSFDGESAPDRISARAGLKELQKIAPSRRSADVDFNGSFFFWISGYKAEFAVKLQAIEPIIQIFTPPCQFTDGTS